MFCFKLGTRDLQSSERSEETTLISLTWLFYLIPDHLKTQFLCIKALVELSGDPLNVLDNFKIQGISDDTVRTKTSTRCYVSLTCL